MATRTPARPVAGKNENIPRAFLCDIGNCTTPQDCVERVHHSGDPNNMFLDLCLNHRSYFPEWSIPWSSTRR